MQSASVWAELKRVGREAARASKQKYFANKEMKYGFQNQWKHEQYIPSGKS